jgi:hypothetical protein
LRAVLLDAQPAEASERLPPQARAMQQVNYASARLYRSLRDEFADTLLVN